MSGVRVTSLRPKIEWEQFHSKQPGLSIKACKTVILKVTILQHLSDKVGKQLRKRTMSSRKTQHRSFLFRSFWNYRDFWDFTIKSPLPCEFNLVAVCAELALSVGTMMVIKTIVAENERLLFIIHAGYSIQRRWINNKNNRFQAKIDYLFYRKIL